MNVVEIMSSPAHTCSTSDTLARAAQLMWERDCGVLPVVDGAGQVVAMITDRDICMATYFQGRPPMEIPVMVAASRFLYSVRPNDPVEVALARMRTHQTRRLPVIDERNNLIGVISVADIIRASGAGVGPGGEVVAAALADISQSRANGGRDDSPRAPGELDHAAA
jgi:CBS domain-containing protein